MVFLLTMVNNMQDNIHDEITWSDVKKNPEYTSKFIQGFYDMIDSLGEIVIGTPTNDYIINIFESNGYWSGVSYNIFFDFEFGFEYEQRRFGN
jgi:hypothetical protein